MSNVTAWFIHVAIEFPAALGERELMHIVETPALERVSQTPCHCQYILVWEDELLPVTDLKAWLIGEATDPSIAKVGIVGWQEAYETTPHYGALLFSDIPRRITVADEHACALPPEPVRWQDIAIWCFQHEERVGPILDVPRIFSGALVSG